MLTFEERLERLLARRSNKIGSFSGEADTSTSQADPVSGSFDPFAEPSISVPFCPCTNPGSTDPVGDNASANAEFLGLIVG